MVGLVGELAGDVDRLAVGIGLCACGRPRRSPRAGSRADRCAGGRRRTSRCACAAASRSRSVRPSKLLSSAGHRARVGRRRRRRRAEDAAQHPVAALDRARPQRRRRRRQHRAEAQRAAAVERAGAVDLLQLVGRCHVRRRCRRTSPAACSGTCSRRGGSPSPAGPARTMYSKVETASSYIADFTSSVNSGKRAGVDAAILVEVVEAEPLPEELGGEAARLRIGGHALDLLRQHAPDRSTRRRPRRGAARRPGSTTRGRSSCGWPSPSRSAASRAARRRSRRGRGTPATPGCARAARAWRAS